MLKTHGKEMYHLFRFGEILYCCFVEFKGRIQYQCKQYPPKHIKEEKNRIL